MKRKPHSAGVAVRRVMLALGVVSGLVVGAPELTWPYVTVSDVLATSGGSPLYASWVAALAMWVALHGPANVHSFYGTVAALAPLFPLPYGTPFLLRHGATAPVACLLHGAWALSSIGVAYVGLAECRRAVAALAVTVGVMYFGGQVVECPWMVAVGCAAEWALLFVPALYI
jgi:hypothetical protein